MYNAVKSRWNNMSLHVVDYYTHLLYIFKNRLDSEVIHNKYDYYCNSNNYIQGVHK